jgi:RNA polymerase sigma factor (sigma-70 family)
MPKKTTPSPIATTDESVAVAPDLDSVPAPIVEPTLEKPGVYVTNKALLAEFAKSKERGEMTNELAKMVMLICERYARRGSYASYTYNEDLQSFALMNLVKSWKSFNPEKSQNPFAYFTSCIHNSFLQYLNQERKHRNIRDALLVENGLDPSYTYSGSYEYNTPDSPTSDNQPTVTDEKQAETAE